MFAIIVVSFFWIFPALGAWDIAKRKNRNQRLWAVAGVLFSWFAVVLLALLTKRDQKIAF